MKKDPRELPRIYLDTNHWIELARIAQGKNKDPLCQKLYEDLIELSNSNKILIPFSSYNFFEIIKQHNQQRREKMIDFLVDMSNGWFFQPIDKFFINEIQISCARRLGIPKNSNLSFQLLSNRPDSILGKMIGKVEVREGYSLLEEERKRLQIIWDNAMQDPTIMKEILKSQLFNFYANEYIKGLKKYAKQIEKDRQNTYKISNAVFDKYLKMHYVFDLFVPDFSKILCRIRVQRKQFFDNKKELKLFIENTPALNVFIELSYTRDRESKERMVKQNDYYDICHFATALPYSNIMVGEKMFSNISKRSKLDQKNGCHLFSSLNELAQCNIYKLL